MRFALRTAAFVAALTAGFATCSSALGQGAAVSGTLFYTTFSSPNVSLPSITFTPATVDKLSFNYDGGATPSSLNLSGITTLATLPNGQNADGIIFDNSGNLLVGSAGINVSIPALGFSISGTNQIVRFTQAGGASTGSATTPDGPFHLTLSPDGNTVYSGGTFGLVSEPIVGPLPINGDTPGHLVSTPSNLSSSGTEVSTSGDDTTFTQLAFTPGGKVFYTSSPDTGTGDYGTINLATGVSTKIGGSDSAHGILYDPFSNTIIMTGGDQVIQLDPITGATIATLTIGTQLDQGSTDGLGHLFIGDNNGSVAFIDFSATKNIGDPADVVFEKFVQTNLDDLAPLNATGAPPVITPTPPGGGGAVPLPASAWMALITLAGIGLVSTIRNRKASSLA